MSARPQRRSHPRRRDEFVYPGATAADLTIGNALAPFDHAIRESDRRWGVDRLQELVSPETAAKWGSAMGKLNAAIEGQDVDTLVQRVGVCIRGLAAMDAEAIARGHRPVPAEAWEIEVAGKRGFLVRDAAMWPVLAKDFPGATIWTLGEVQTALAGLGNMVAEVKAHFDRAEVKEVRRRTPTEEAIGDEIPW